MSCKYAEVGCQENPLRKDLKRHEENDQLHLRAITAKVLELTQQLNENVEQLTFRLDSFPRHKMAELHSIVVYSAHLTKDTNFEFRSMQVVMALEKALTFPSMPP